MSKKLEPFEINKLNTVLNSGTPFNEIQSKYIKDNLQKIFNKACTNGFQKLAVYIYNESKKYSKIIETIRI